MTDTYAALEASFTKDRSRLRSREVAYEAIKNAILSGLLPPHERLIEERIGEALHISRTPVREALAILEHEGLLEAIPYKGLAVRPVSREEFQHLYDGLGVIESALARAAATNASPAAIRQMDALLSEAEGAIPDDAPRHLAACREFQSVLGGCANSPFLTRTLVGIEERSDMYLLNTGLSLPAEKMQAAVDDRRRILEAVMAGDPEAAANAAHAHARSIVERWGGLYHD